MDEFELIDRITQRFTANPDVLLGPGDDAALLAVHHGAVLASTDILIEDVHFRQDWTTPYDLGRRAAAQNLADITAMGCTASALLVAVAAPRDTPPEWFTELARGLEDECARVGASVIGGDLAAGSAIVVSVTVLGDPGAGAPVTRAGARIGDTVAVAGRLGWSATGLLAHAHGVDVDPALLAAYRVPEPPYAAGPAGRAAGATAMIDVSDGLVADAGHIADASDVTFALTTAALAADATVAEASASLGVDPMVAVLTGGEDHAILATFPGAAPAPFRAIGTVVPRGAHSVLIDGAPHAGRKGHDHFG